jgi:hypothetical protein
MAAVAQLVSEDPQEQQSVAAVLREHPELQDFIGRVTDKAEEIFPESSFSVDTVRYDEWDAPVRMFIRITQPWDDYKVVSDQFFHWFAHQPDYDPDLILVMPLWDGPLESYRR